MTVPARGRREGCSLAPNPSSYFVPDEHPYSEEESLGGPTAVAANSLTPPSSRLDKNE